jgi:integrase
MIASHIPQDLNDYFNRIFRPKKLLGKSERTAKIYTETFTRFGEYLQHKPTLADLTEDLICGFLDWRLSAGRAYHTVDKESNKLVALANFAARRRHIDAFIDPPPIDPPESIPTCWSLDQIETLLAACRDAKGCFGMAPRSAWWLAFHFVCLATGERTEAMLMLRWDMLKGVNLNVPPSVRKGRRKAARYRLPAEVLRVLEKLRPYTDGGRIFAVPWKQILSSFYYHYTRLLKAAKLPSGRDFKPQQLRRSFASYLEAAGGDATEALGHVDRRTTKQSYLDTSITEAGKESPSIVVWRQLGLSS